MARRELCDVVIPPNDCRDFGSALFFTGDADQWSIRGLITYFPRSAERLHEPVIRGAEALRGLMENVLYTCTNEQSNRFNVDMSVAAQCIARQLTGTLPELIDHVPRSVAVMSSDHGNFLPQGLHILREHTFTRDIRPGLFTTLITYVQL